MTFSILRIGNGSTTIHFAMLDLQMYPKQCRILYRLLRFILHVSEVYLHPIYYERACYNNNKRLHDITCKKKMVGQSPSVNNDSMQQPSGSFLGFYIAPTAYRNSKYYQNNRSIGMHRLLPFGQFYS